MDTIIYYIYEYLKRFFVFNTFKNYGCYVFVLIVVIHQKSKKDNINEAWS